MRVSADIVHMGLALGIVASLTLNVVLLNSVTQNRVHLADIEGRIVTGTTDRYRSADAKRDFAQIREIMDASAMSRDQKLLAIDQKLKAIEAKLNEKSE